jgi:hypothetical protein
MENKKDLLVGSFYMPHREQKHLEELSKSLKKIENHNITNIVLTGDLQMILLVLDLIQILGLTDCFPELASRVFGLGCSHPLDQLVLVG